MYFPKDYEKARSLSIHRKTRGQACTGVSRERHHFEMLPARDPRVLRPAPLTRAGIIPYYNSCLGFKPDLILLEELLL
jgi:hypothetical protein